MDQFSDGNMEALKPPPHRIIEGPCTANSRLASRRALVAGIVSGGFTSILFTHERALAEIAGLADGLRGASVKFSNGSTSTVWINFEMPDYRRVILPARINGKSVKVLLDSGIGSTILSKSLAEDLGLRKLGSVHGVGVTGTAQGQVVEGVTISFDNLSISTSESELYDMTPFAGLLSEPIGALIGRDLFDSVIVDIDFAATRIALRDRNSAAALPDAFRLPLHPDRFGLRGVPISLEGRPPIQATLDLGSDRPLSIAPQYAASQNLLSNRTTSTTLSAGVAGSQEGRIAILSKLAVGPAVFSQVPFQVPGTWDVRESGDFGPPGDPANAHGHRFSAPAHLSGAQPDRHVATVPKRPLRARREALSGSAPSRACCQEQSRRRGRFSYRR